MRTGFSRLRRLFEIAQAGVRKAPEVGNDRGAQFGQQPVETESRVGCGQ
ncbi:MAG: hypothetical protein LH480_09035 [Rubrivivax sp.]|nr:hypothetical protein [Rubrivivax sp.]